MGDASFGLWDDMDTLVFERDDLLQALDAARPVLDAEPAPVPLPRPTLVVVAGGEDDDLEEDVVSLDGEDDDWLDALPAETRDALERLSRPAPAWPDAPRLAHAVARPAVAA